MVHSHDSNELKIGNHFLRILAFTENNIVENIPIPTNLQKRQLYNVY